MTFSGGRLANSLLASRTFVAIRFVEPPTMLVPPTML